MKKVIFWMTFSITFRAVVSLITMENNNPQLVILVMQLKMYGYVARQSPDSQTDGEFFFHLFKSSLNILMATAVVVVTVHVTRSRFLFSTGVR